MRATIHNGRTGKDGAYNTKHNDRQFDISHAEHIDPERVKNNRYWNWTGNPETTFEAAEAAFYEKHIRQHLDAQNARYTAQRHAERAKTMDEYRRSPQTCPEEVILQIGKAGDTIPADMMARIIQEQINWEQQTFPGVRVLDVALHMDEQGAPHIHERRAWVYTDKNGNLAISQNKSLEQMGVELPNPDRPRGRYNNRKQTFSRMCREHLLQICKAHGLEIEEIPQEKSRSGLSHVAYMTRQEEEKAASAELRRQFSERAAESAEKQAESARDTARSYEEHAEQVARQINNEYGELADAGLQKQEMQEQLEQLQERLDNLQEQLEYARADYKKAYQKCRRAERRAADLQSILTAAERRQVEQIRQEQEREQKQFEEDEWERE
jgi:hypothetical protein